MPLGRGGFPAPPERPLERKNTVERAFDYEKLCDFDHLYRAYLASRRGKRSTREVVLFEMDAGPNLARILEELETGTYRFGGYYHFTIHDPKVREIYALHYRDRIVQHCLCDEILAPWFERHLIYDSAACRRNKGTHFAMNRLNRFLREHYRKYGREGWILKCDVRKFFDSIDHGILKCRLSAVVDDPRTLALLGSIIDSYETAPGKGLPMGNQTSQWFALFYLDPLDRLVKERLRIRHYTRYMDDCILLCRDRVRLAAALSEMRALLGALGLSFNEKTQIFPIRAGVEYLGWRFSLTENGAVVRRLKKQSCLRWQHRLRRLSRELSSGETTEAKIRETMQSYQNHLRYGNTGRLYRATMEKHRSLWQSAPERTQSRAPLCG